MIDIICQILIVAFGVPAFILVLRDSVRVQYIGAILGCMTLPFWFATFIINKQWIAIIMEFVYTYGWIDKLIRVHKHLYKYNPKT